MENEQKVLTSVFLQPQHLHFSVHATFAWKTPFMNLEQSVDSVKQYLVALAVVLETVAFLAVASLQMHSLQLRSTLAV